MASVLTTNLLPEELEGLGLTGLPPSTVELPGFPSEGDRLKPAVGTVDQSRVPEPSPGVVAAAQAIEAGKPEAPKISPQDAEEQMAFLVHLLGGKPFRKTFSYFGGQIQVTMRSRTSLEDELCAREIARLPMDLPPVEYVRLYGEFAQLLSLEEVQLGDQPPNRFNFTADIARLSLMEQRDALFSRLQGPLGELIRTSYAGFDKAYQGLMARRNDPDFLKAGSPK